jgi:uncharacterized protein (TIGR03437 family)
MMKRMERGLLRAVCALSIGLTIPVLAYGQTPSISTGGTLNAADYSRSFAPGVYISIFGSNLASSTQQAQAYPLPTSLGGASVELASNGEQFPLLYASPTQINAQMPYDVPIGQVQIRVRTAAGVSNADTITVSAPAPSILTGGTVNAADYSRSFAPGGYISIFGSNLASSTQQAQAYPFPTSLGGASVELVGSNGEQFPLWYASPTQINAQMPYDVPIRQVQVRVLTAAGASNIDTITVSARAPKIFTLDFSGHGAAVATNTSFQVLTAALPVKPADTIVLWMNSLGATSGNPVAGQPAPGTTPGSQPDMVLGVTATINGLDAPVSFAGLSPGSSGLYQANVQAPFTTITGPVAVQVMVGGVTTQANVTIPFRQLGFYFSILGGKAVSGQTLNGVSGATSALAYRQSDPLTWGTTGLNAWTNNTGLGTAYSIASGLALTLRNGTSVVYDNNGLETASFGTFYDNTNGPPNSQKPGLSDFYSMSNYFPLIFAGYFKLAQATTITELIGYFDALGVLDLPFDPQNPYVRYRMNIWSSVSGNLPKETSNFTGDVFSSDTTAGTFTFSDTGVKVISSIPPPQDLPKAIYRLSYRLASPLTLPAGEYWFSHDASVRALPATSSTAQMRLLSLDDLHQWISSQRPQQKGFVRFSLFGREMSFEDSWTLPEAVVVKPSAVIEHQ